ncbi:sigma 54-interacting transcriptional regulator [Blastopirellula sp. JC732]|uniref:Sigma 54-interacting transcriptional regulator n=1 Tax=Blastopirellula sediminis TaxID=2894196 RepID=A0A9X1MJL7_9BACT|nr:sigma 54-interacting transcriptional regulator [Blastopirellula sediminis]MCC9609487.1 sigma 54-interacting transcriptional regulator [Blastopirellula sediminis]MCC9627736.1 sigma 54-interacting transcriptional regulator [Blastopirellula sediminis]
MQIAKITILAPAHDPLEDLRSSFCDAAPGSKVQIVRDDDDLLGELRSKADDSLFVIHGRRASVGLVGAMRELSTTALIVIAADQGSVETAASAIGMGANDFLVRGPQLTARVATLLGKMGYLLEVLREARTLDAQNTELQKDLQFRCQIIGQSPQIQAIVERVQMVARVPRPVLIVGERGTGKEVIARAIHFAQGDHLRPIVTVNCAAFSTELLESELFGHERGAFTGADQTRDGKFGLAHGGTLVLDEIGHMSLPFQRKILRVVEYGTYNRVGGQKELITSARIIAATNVDLRKRIQEGEFLSDLYDRLAFEVIEVPPLRGREGDIEVLAQHFLDQFAREIPLFAGKRLSRSAIDVLRRYQFPGNVRELKNIIERAAYRDTTDEITPDDIGMLANTQIEVPGGSFKDRLDNFGRMMLEDALAQSRNNQAAAARQLGLSYHQFRYYYGKYLGEEAN